MKDLDSAKNFCSLIAPKLHAKKAESALRGRVFPAYLFSDWLAKDATHVANKRDRQEKGIPYAIFSAAGWIIQTASLIDEQSFSVHIFPGPESKN